MRVTAASGSLSLSVQWDVHDEPVRAREQHSFAKKFRENVRRGFGLVGLHGGCSCFWDGGGSSRGGMVVSWRADWLT